MLHWDLPSLFFFKNFFVRSQSYPNLADGIKVGMGKVSGHFQVNCRLWPKVARNRKGVANDFSNIGVLGKLADPLWKVSLGG